MSNSLHASVLLSAQRALLGEVTANLEAVAVAVNDKRITVYFYYRQPATEDEQESANVAATEILADFSEHDVDDIVVEFGLWPVAGELPDATWVFMRQQPEQDG